MKKCLFITVLLGGSLSNFAQNYQISTDLRKVKRDQISVTVYTPPVVEDSIAYVFPAVIPGSYSRKDFGRFITDFKAYDQAGKRLPVRKEGNNLFWIIGSKNLKSIEYLVNDTWDAPDDNFIFQPGGTQIDKGKSFMINHQGFWGYLEGYKMIPYEITIARDKKFFASTALEASRGDGIDLMRADNYVQLVDNPIMYSLPDTTSFQAGKTRVHTSVFSESSTVSSRQVEELLKPLALALDTFFGGMPVDNYHFIFYFADMEESEVTRNGGFGALEHSYSSVYFLPELEDTSRLNAMIRSVSAHEFLHILTPLNVHSEEIEFFDFRNPKMSAHLWMYEGVTEYFSHLVQLSQGLIDQEEFNREMASKIRTASNHPDVSFTNMSKNILSDEFKDMYSNVYYKGALIAFLLDIRIQELSEGEFGLKEVMMELTGKYGPSRPFKDDQLFAEFENLTYPEIGMFLKTYVDGDTPLPLETYFRKIGLIYYPSKKDTIITFGNLSFAFNEKTKKIVVDDAPDGQNVFGLKEGDVLVSVDGVKLDEDNFRTAMLPFHAQSDQTLKLVYKREDVENSIVRMPIGVPVEIRHVVESDPFASSEAMQLRRALIK